MKLKIIGSGGCVSIPRPLCRCNICTEAREKGFPYARCGCSLYIEDVNILIDSPEDIACALNNADIKNIDYILYSHIDPDHTMGMRVIEQLRLDWLANSIGINCKNPITIASLHIDLVPVDESARVTVFVFTEGLHKVIYAPCDVKPFPENDIFMGADCLIIGDTIVADILKGGFVLGKDNPLRDELFVMDEIIELKDKYHIERVIITHLEEDWGKSYDDYRNLQRQLDGIEFAYDGLEIIF